jgi:phosphoserine phosphatase
VSCGYNGLLTYLDFRAMGGNVPFEDALQARLDIIQPSKKMLEDFATQDPLQLNPGMHDVVKALRARNVDVYFISGGFTQMIQPWATKLGLPPSHVLANTICFDDAGHYAGYDDTAFTCRSGGKATAMRFLIDSGCTGPIVMVGDGVTDLEARPPADLMIGYGGVAKRAAVVKGADWFITDFSELVGVLVGGDRFITDFSERPKAPPDLKRRWQAHSTAQWTPRDGS